MLIATVSTFIILSLMLFFPIPADNAQILLAIIGPTLGFFFGSSVNKQRPPEPTKGDPSNETITAEKVTIATSPAAVPDA
jgi:hypothetical protein